MFISSYFHSNRAIDGSGVQVETDMLMTPVDVLEAILGCKQR